MLSLLPYCYVMIFISPFEKRKLCLFRKRQWFWAEGSPSRRQRTRLRAPAPPRWPRLRREIQGLKCRHRKCTHTVCAWGSLKSWRNYIRIVTVTLGLQLVFIFKRLYFPVFLQTVFVITFFKAHLYRVYSSNF